MSDLPLWSEIAASDVTPNQMYQRAIEFYAPEKLAWKQAAEYLKTNFPDRASAIVAQAQEFLQGKMVLCGTMGKPFFVGNPPRWSENPVGDAEFVFMLNRMEHWYVLLQAYALTENRVYADKIVSELDNWIDTCPPLPISLDYKVAKPRFSAPTPWRSLELGIRANRSWNYVLHLLTGEPCFSVEIFRKMICSLYQHAVILFQVCPVLWPKADHNHYLTECLGLLEISCLCNFLTDAPIWRAHAIHELERCATNQILPSGGQIEGAPTYHNECLFQMTYSLQLANRYQFEFSPQYHNLVHSMLTRSIYTTRPNGVQVAWGDSDAVPLVFRAAFCHYKAFGELAALEQVASLFGKEGLLNEFPNQIWSLPNTPATAQWLANMCPPPPRLPVFYHDEMFKQVMLRTGWNIGADSVFFSVRSPIHNDHSHIDPNAFEYFSHGYAVMPDPGRFTYREGGDRHYYKSTEAHNTLTINGLDAFSYQGTWAYGSQKQGGILSTALCGDWSYVCGWHENYAPAIHKRALILIDGCLFVFDAVDGLETSDIVTVWFLFDSVQAHLTSKCFYASCGNERLVTTLSYTGAATAAILAGRISPTADHEHNARRLCLTADGKPSHRVFSAICCREIGHEIVAENLNVEETPNTFLLSAWIKDHCHIFTIDKNTWKITKMR